MLDINDEKNDSCLQTFFKGKVVFLTGGTGFLGKLFIEKFLRCEVKEINLLVRAKKNKTTPERLIELLNKEPVFTKFKDDPDYYLKRIKLVEGDMKKLNLGLSNEDLEYLGENVQIVTHAAADVRFDESLKEAIEINVRGTREMLIVAHTFKKLEVFTYISTAYSNCNRRDIKETFYAPPADPDVMIGLIDNIEEEQLQIISRKIIDPWPNTYAFTKALAEELVRRYGHKMPVVIMRPSIVITTHKDPIPGWADNIYGLNGVVVGVGTGVLRVLHIDNRLKADIIPADYVINSTMAAIWYTATNNNNVRAIETTTDTEEIIPNANDNNANIYHCTIYKDNPITWGDVKEKNLKFSSKIPFRKSLWIVTYNTTKYYALSEIMKIFYHVIPAFIVDMYLRIRGRNPKLLKMYKKVHKFAEVLAFFTNNQWKFDNTNMRRVFNEMSEEDHKMFPCDMKRMKWDDYLGVYISGLREHVMKDPIENVPEAKIRYRKMLIIHYTFISLLYIFYLYLFVKLFSFYGFFDYAENIFTSIKND